MMVEHGERFWKTRWGPLYGALGGNPLAAMPSLHFATSVMAAHVLAEAGPVQGALGWTYAITLGFALVYLGEHYVVDLHGGAGADRRRASGRAARGADAPPGVARRGGARGEGTRMTSAPVEAARRAARPTSTRRRRSMRIPRRQAVVFGIFVFSAIAFLYFGLPRLAGFGETWERLEHGRPGWLVVAARLECMSFVGYVWLFRTVFVRERTRVDWQASYQITLAGVAATRLFAAAGAGGIALTAWALRRSGMERRTVACRMVAFIVLLYTVYGLGLLVGGLGLYTGMFDGGGAVRHHGRAGGLRCRSRC